MRNMLASRVVRFLLSGTTNTLLTIAIYGLLSIFLSYGWAYSIAYTVGIATAYWLNTIFVFRVAPTIRTFAIYPFIYIIQYLFGLAALSASVEIFRLSRFAGIFFSIAVTLPVTFLLTRLLLIRAKDHARTY